MTTDLPPGWSCTGHRVHARDRWHSFCPLEAMRRSSARLTPLLLTVPDTARRLQRHEQTVRAMIRRGDLAAIRLGRLVRVLAAAVDQTGVTLERAVRLPTSPQALRRFSAGSQP